MSCSAVASVKTIGLIGAGHLAGYLLEGLGRADAGFSYLLADPCEDRGRELARKCGGRYVAANQEAVTGADLVILAVRPADVTAALTNLEFQPHQWLVSVAAGVELDRLNSLAAPAQVVRALPIACAAVNQSPTLIHPPAPPVESLFEHLGTVHVLEDEAGFTPGTALVGALFAWMIPLMEQLAQWTEEQHIAPDTARALVQETLAGSCALAQSRPDLPLSQIWETLATPGGISEHGAQILEDAGAFAAFPAALSAVTKQRKSQNQDQE